MLYFNWSSIAINHMVNEIKQSQIATLYILILFHLLWYFASEHLNICIGTCKIPETFMGVKNPSTNNKSIDK